MSKLNLFTGCATAALFIAVSSGVAFSQAVKEVNIPDASGWDINQVTTNKDSVYNTAFENVGNISPSARGSSVGASAVGAQSAVAGTFINEIADVTVGDIKQTTNQSDIIGAQPTPEISNVARIQLGNINGNGASVQISSAGAVSAVSASYVNSTGNISFDAIEQNTYNNKNSSGKGVYTKGDIDTKNGGYVQIGGHGASLSISAIGAASSISVSGIGRDGVKSKSIDNVGIGAGNTGTVKQTTVNKGAVTTKHVEHVSGNQPGKIKVKNGISGVGSSVSVSSAGAVSSLSVASVNNVNIDRTITIGDVTQSSTSSGNITTKGGSITVGNISGNGSGASISATGSATQVSVASINSSADVTATIGQVSQTSTNSGAVSNSGNITAGNLTGAGTSVSVGAVGAASAVSFSAVK